MRRFIAILAVLAAIPCFAQTLAINGDTSATSATGGTLTTTASVVHWDGLNSTDADFKWSATVLGGDDEVAARVGAVWDQFELGFQSNVLETRGNDRGHYGLYGQANLDPVYAGAFWVYDYDSTDDGAIYGFMGGLRAPLEGNLSAVAEVQYRVYAGVLRDLWGQDEVKGFLGLKLEF